jgi:hypothetical protein
MASVVTDAWLASYEGMVWHAAETLLQQLPYARKLFPDRQVSNVGELFLYYSC